MQMPPEAFSANLTDYQFRLLATLCHLSGFKGHYKASAKDLSIVTGNVHPKTVRRALKALEEAGLIFQVQSHGTKGKQTANVIHIGNPKVQVDSSVHPTRDANVHPAHDYVTNSYLNHPANMSLVPNNHINQDSYKYFETEGFKKEIKLPMRKYDDDSENLAGFGLIEPKDVPQPKVRKSDPRTRGKRPEHEWTPMDVAAEFSFRVGRKYPLLPGTVNVKALSGALARFRKQYQTTALIELELLKLFMGNEDNFRQIGDEAPFLYKKFLSSFGYNMNRARENLGLAKVTAKVDTREKSDRLTASDGRTFQNSLSGRAQLERHEKRLKEAK